MRRGMRNKAIALVLGTILTFTTAFGLTGCGGSGSQGNLEKEKPLSVVYVKSDGIYMMAEGSDTPRCLAELPAYSDSYGTTGIYGNMLFYSNALTQEATYKGPKPIDVYAMDIEKAAKDETLEPVKIAKDVTYALGSYTYFQVLPDGKGVAYLKGSTEDDVKGTLYYSKEEGGKWTEYEVAENVSGYYLSPDLLVYVYNIGEEDPNSEWDIEFKNCAYDIKGDEGSVTLDGDTYLGEVLYVDGEIFYVDRTGCMPPAEEFYMGPPEDVAGILYKTDFGGKTKKIAENVTMACAADGGLIYHTVPESMIGLTVSDLMAEDYSGPADGFMRDAYFVLSNLYAGDLVMDAYYYRDGKSTLLCENACAADYPSFLNFDTRKDVLFRTIKGIDEGLTLSSFSFMDDIYEAVDNGGYNNVKDLMESDSSRALQLLLGDLDMDVVASFNFAKTVPLVKDLSEKGFTYAYGDLLPGSKWLLINLSRDGFNGEEASYIGVVENGALMGKLKKLSSDRVYLPEQPGGETFYYTVDKYDEYGDVDETTIYSYDGEKSSKVVDSQGSLSQFKIVDENRLVYVKNIDFDSYMGEFVLWEKGEEKLSFEDVYNYRIRGEKIYLATDYSSKRYNFDLYVTDLAGAEPVLVDEAALWFIGEQ